MSQEIDGIVKEAYADFAASFGQVPNDDEVIDVTARVLSLARINKVRVTPVSQPLKLKSNASNQASFMKLQGYVMSIIQKVSSIQMLTAMATYVDGCTHVDPRRSHRVIERVKQLVGNKFQPFSSTWPINPAKLRAMASLSEPEDADALRTIYLFYRVTHGYVWGTTDGLCVMKKPSAIKMTADGKAFHAVSAPAVQIGTWKFYCLHGIEVPAWVVETPEEKITAEQYFGETNLDVRRELGLKVGLPRILSKLSGLKEVERLTKYGIEDMYTLLRFEMFGETRVALRMKNPSLPINPDKHEYVETVEYVPGDTATVDAAIAFRNDLREDQIDDIGGRDYYQQGDVLIKPANATKFKRYPVQLT